MRQYILLILILVLFSHLLAINESYSAFATEKIAIIRAEESKSIFNKPRVRVFYFYPSDYQPDQRYIDAINPFIKDIQEWYAEQLGGNTFYFEPVVLYQSNKITSEYLAEDQIWADVIKELKIQCGYGNVVALVFLARTLEHGNGRSCGPWYSGEFNGDITVSEANFDAEIIAVTTGYCPNGYSLGDWHCSPQAQRGGIAHELGHAFSLPHPWGCSVQGLDYCSKTVMWSWWNWPNVGLLDEEFAPEKKTIKNSAWFWQSSSLEFYAIQRLVSL